MLGISASQSRQQNMTDEDTESPSDLVASEKQKYWDNSSSSDTKDSVLRTIPSVLFLRQFASSENDFPI